MTTWTQPLREEHQEFLPSLDQLQTVADMVGTADNASLREGVDDVYRFLSQHLLPHAQAEERALYPAVGRLMGAAQATATMSHDHREIHRLTEELGKLRSALQQGALDAAQEQDLRRVLYGLSILVRLHLAKEEEIYLPLLDAHLTAESARQLFEELEQAAQEAKRRAEHASTPH